MHRIDSAGNLAGQFTNGSAATGVPATVVDADWLNAMQEELAAVVEGAGIDLEKGNNGQLLAALTVLMGGAGRALPDPYFPDAQAPAENDAQQGSIKFPAGVDAITWNHVELWRSGVDWRVTMEAKASTAEATGMALRVAYLLVPEGGANPVAKDRWAANTAYQLGDRVIPLLTHLNGFYYECTTAGTSGGAQPGWGVVAEGTTNDGTAVWTAKAGGLKLLTLAMLPANAAWQRFEVDAAALTIPEAEAEAGDRLHLGICRLGSADAHGGDLYLVEGRVVPVEV